MTVGRAARRALTVVVLIVLGSTLHLAPGHAQDGEEPEAFSGTGAVDLVQQATWIPPDGDVTLQLDISAAPRDAVLEVTFHDRLAGRYQLEPSFRGESIGRRLRTITSSTVAEADLDGDGRVSLRLGLRSGSSGETDRLLISRAGLHPIQVVVRTPGGETIGGFVTHVVRLPTEVDHELGLAVIQTVDAAPSRRADGTIEVSAQTRADLTATTAALLPSLGVPITYRLTPETLDALTTSTAELDAALIAELRELVAGGSVAASPYVRLDVDAVAEAGMRPALHAQLDLGSSTLAGILGTTVDRTTWVADETLATAGLVALADEGIERFVIPDGSLVGPTAEHPLQPVDIGDGGMVRRPALTTDALVQSHAGSTGSAVLDAQHLLSDLAAIWLDRPAVPRATVLELPAGQPDRTFVRTALAGISTSPLVEPGGVGEVIDAVDQALVAESDTGDGDESEAASAEHVLFGLAERDVPDLSSHRTQVRRTTDLAATSARVFPSSEDVTSDPIRIAVSSSADLTPRERSNHLEAITDRIASDFDNIAMPEQAAVTLPSRDGVIPITLVNNTGKPAAVAIELDSDKLEFPDGDRVEVTLEEVLNPIEIRVRVRSSGAFPLEMSLETPDGQVQLVDSTYTIRSTAVSGLGIALSVAAVVVLAVWWFRTARRARQAHRETVSAE